MNDLRGLAPGATDSLMLLGYHEPGDGGGGAFFWDGASTDPDDVATVIVPDTNPAQGRWRRVVTSPLSVRWFGAIGDGSSHPVSQFFPTLADAQARYPHVVDFGDEIDWAAIQSALDWFPPTAALGKGGGEVRIPAGDFRVSRPLEISEFNIALVGEVRFASSLTYSASGNWKGPFTFVRSGLDTRTQSLFRIEVRDLFLDSGTNPPRDSIGLNVTGMSYSDFRNVSIQFRSDGCTGVYGTGENGGSPYYNLFTNVSVFGAGSSYTANGCRGYWFTGDPNLPDTHPRRRWAPNANCIRGGYLVWLEYGYDDSGTGNTVLGLVTESVRVAYEIGEDATGAYVGFKGSTNHTTIVGPYMEDGGPNSTALNIRETAAAVGIFAGYRTGYNVPINDEGTSTTMLPGGNFSNTVHGRIGGHVDFRGGDSLYIKNAVDNLVLETELSSVAFEPTIRLNQKHANDVRIRNGSASAGSGTLLCPRQRAHNGRSRISVSDTRRNR
jgi:hypothetical protein